jgi:uncharacterized protein
MSSDSRYNSSDDEGSDERSNDYVEDSTEAECEEWEELTEADLDLFEAITRNDGTGVRLALRSGAKVNCNHSEGNHATPLYKASTLGYDEIVRILLDAGADIRWRDWRGQSALWGAVGGGHLSTVEILHNHDNGLLNDEDRFGETILQIAILDLQFEIVRFLLDRGANALVITEEDEATTLMLAWL